MSNETPLILSLRPTTGRYDAVDRTTGRAFQLDSAVPNIPDLIINPADTRFADRPRAFLESLRSERLRLRLEAGHNKAPKRVKKESTTDQKGISNGHSRKRTKPGTKPFVPNATLLALAASNPALAALLAAPPPSPH